MHHAFFSCSYFRQALVLLQWNVRSHGYVYQPLILLPLLLTLAHAVQKVPASLNNDLMVLLLFQTTDDNNGHNTLDSLDPDREATTVNGKLLCLVLQTVLFGKGLFVTGKLVVHVPSRSAESEHRGTLPCYPGAVVWGDAATNSGIKEGSAVCEGD